MNQKNADPCDRLLPQSKTMDKVLGKKERNARIKLREAVRCNLATLHPEVVTWIGVSPLHANLRITHRCPARCTCCRHWLESNDGELTTEEWKSVLSKMRDAGFVGASLTGGDILMRSDALELLRYATGIGLGVHVTLNGFTLKETFARELMDAAPLTVNLSLDDLTDHLDQIRGVKHASRKINASIHLLRRFENGKTRLGISQTIMKSTLRAVRDVANYALQNDLRLSFNLVHFTHYFTDTPFSRDQYALDPVEQKELLETVEWLAQQRPKHPDRLPKLTHLQWILRYFRDYRQEEIPCYKPLLKICVDPNGDVRPCCSMDPVGNLVNQSVESVLRSPLFLAVTKRGLAKDCPGCSCHYPMSLDYSLKSRIQEGLLRFGLAGFDKKNGLDRLISLG